MPTSVITRMVECQTLREIAEHGSSVVLHRGRREHEAGCGDGVEWPKRASDAACSSRRGGKSETRLQAVAVAIEDAAGDRGIGGVEVLVGFHDQQALVRAGRRRDLKRDRCPSPARASRSARPRRRRSRMVAVRPSGTRAPAKVWKPSSTSEMTSTSASIGHAGPDLRLAAEAQRQSARPRRHRSSSAPRSGPRSGRPPRPGPAARSAGA